MVNVDLYSAIITKVSNALDTLVSGEKPGFQTLSEGLANVNVSVNSRFTNRIIAKPLMRCVPLAERVNESFQVAAKLSKEHDGSCG